MLELDLGRSVRRFPTWQNGSHVLSFDLASRTLAVSNTDDGSVTLIGIDSGEIRIVELVAGSEFIWNFRNHPVITHLEPSF